MSRQASFSRQVKNELCRISAENPCCQQAELAVALVSAGRFRGDRVSIATAHAQYAQRLVGLMASCYSFETQIKQGSELLTMTFSGQEPYDSLLADLKSILGFDVVRGSLNPDAIHSECCLRSALRGFFLSCGSIAEPQTAYHLELSIRRPAAAALAAGLLARVDMHSGLLVRNGYSVVYLKEGQFISDFLLQTGAHESLLTFESLRVEKEMRNSVNRVVNCDNANSQRIANTSARQLELLRLLDENHVLGSLPTELQDAARARLENPDLSLRELGELMEPAIGKSGMNHRLKKLESIASGRSQPEAGQDDRSEHSRHRT